MVATVVVVVAATTAAVVVVVAATTAAVVVVVVVATVVVAKGLKIYKMRCVIMRVTSIHDCPYIVMDEKVTKS